MSQPRFLADENFRNEIIEAVRRIEPAIEIATVQELTLDGTPDTELLQLAADEGWLLLSHDVNTLEGEACRRVEDGRGIFGVFMVKQFASTKRVAESILTIWGASEAEEWSNQIKYLPFR